MRNNKNKKKTVLKDKNLISITFFSDTHTLHEKVRFSKTGSDILVCCGDISNVGKIPDIINFAKWLDKQKQFKHKVVIAGNHDFCFENENKEKAEKIISNVATYLNDSGAKILGLNFWGSPITPFYNRWAFNRDKGTIKAHWDLIPKDTDILVTHGPPKGILDKVLPLKYQIGLSSEFIITTPSREGCPFLLDKVKEVKPKIHAFGHIHEDYGIKKTKDTTFINASSLDRSYTYKNKPITINIEKERNN